MPTAEIFYFALGSLLLLIIIFFLLVKKIHVVKNLAGLTVDHDHDHLFAHE